MRLCGAGALAHGFDFDGRNCRALPKLDKAAPPRVVPFDLAGLRD